MNRNKKNKKHNDVLVFFCPAVHCEPRLCNDDVLLGGVMEGLDLHEGFRMLLIVI